MSGLAAHLRKIKSMKNFFCPLNNLLTALLIIVFGEKHIFYSIVLTEFSYTKYAVKLVALVPMFSCITAFRLGGMQQ